MKERNTVLVVDRGGRGSALVDKYSHSKHVTRVLAVPGNDLMGFGWLKDKEVQIFPKIRATDISEILELCKKEKVDLVDVAQDNAVEAGLVDSLTQNGIPTVGPTRVAGEIEWNKAWAREFGKKQGLPQPSFKICLTEEEGVDFLKNQPDQKWFVKAAFLAQGKGALPAESNEEAIEKIKELRKRFPESSKVFLLEDWIRGDSGSTGEEFSTFIISDGENYKVIGSAQDYKRANDGDTGENTGSMGSSSPPLILTKELFEDIQVSILRKTIKGLQINHRPYKGVLYLGGMVVKEKRKQKPKVVEFNARWGDPEAQVILPGLLNDLFEVSKAIVEGDISKLKIRTDGKARVVVTGAAKGYPGDYSQALGKEIHGLGVVIGTKGVKVYGANVRQGAYGRLYADGGRLFYIVGEGKTVVEAQEKAYYAMSQISIDGDNLHFRKDIGT